jgi:hypothetical protein
VALAAAGGGGWRGAWCVGDDVDGGAGGGVGNGGAARPGGEDPSDGHLALPAAVTAAATVLAADGIPARAHLVVGCKAAKAADGSGDGSCAAG